MRNSKLPESNSPEASHNPLEETTTYHIEGRSFVVQPVFKTENANAIGDILLRLMQAECEKAN